MTSAGGTTTTKTTFSPRTHRLMPLAAPGGGGIAVPSSNSPRPRRLPPSSSSPAFSIFPGEAEEANLHQRRAVAATGRDRGSETRIESGRLLLDIGTNPTTAATAAAAAAAAAPTGPLGLSVSPPFPLQQQPPPLSGGSAAVAVAVAGVVGLRHAALPGAAHFSWSWNVHRAAEEQWAYVEHITKKN